MKFDILSLICHYILQRIIEWSAILEAFRIGEGLQ